MSTKIKTRPEFRSWELTGLYLLLTWEAAGRWTVADGTSGASKKLCVKHLRGSASKKPCLTGREKALHGTGAGVRAKTADGSRKQRKHVSFGPARALTPVHQVTPRHLPGTSNPRSSFETKPAGAYCVYKPMQTAPPGRLHLREWALCRKLFTSIEHMFS